MRQIDPNPDIFVAMAPLCGMLFIDALTTARASYPESRDASLSGSNAGQGDAHMTNKVSLPTAILSFAFTGVMPFHKRDYEAPRTASQAEPTKKK
jgi:hypothetical protein